MGEQQAKAWERIGTEIGRLVAEKNRAYGSSFQKSSSIMATMYPHGVPVDKLDDALTVVRILDKLFMVAADRDALEESPWWDIVGYGLFALERAERSKSTSSLSDPVRIVESAHRVDCRHLDGDVCAKRNRGVDSCSPTCPLFEDRHVA